MRNFILTLGLLLVISNGLVFSQVVSEKKNNLRIETGPAFTGSGDLSGFCLYNEYSRWIGKRFTLSPAIGFINFYKNDNQDILLLQNANCLSIELSGYYYPIKQDRFSIELGLGSYYRNWHWIYATGADQYFSKEGLTLGPDSYASQVVNGIGYSISFGTLIDLNETFGFNLRGVFQNDTNGDNALTARIGFNIKF